MQINHFTNNTYFTPPSKGGALGATRLASPSSTQRVGEDVEPEVVRRFLKYLISTDSFDSVIKLLNLSENPTSRLREIVSSLTDRVIESILDAERRTILELAFRLRGDAKKEEFGKSIRRVKAFIVEIFTSQNS